MIQIAGKKSSAVKVIAAPMLALGVLTAFIGWYPFAFSLAWPGLALARVGLPHSWILSAILLLGGVTWLAFWARKRTWLRVVIASLFFPACYCVIAFWFLARASVALPAVTPYDAMPAERVAYLQAFDSGYRDGTAGVIRSYCFSPEAETRGFYEGAYQGRIVWCRMFGRTMPDGEKRQFEASAGIDGVRLELK
ncbi:MAG TPA: hypothetical protein VFZ59_06095 [Verrucomicrobiae bacterium]|nr:hypothetical protein [Verrucomicrobiae bacterium]